MLKYCSFLDLIDFVPRRRSGQKAAVKRLSRGRDTLLSPPNLAANRRKITLKVLFLEGFRTVHAEQGPNRG